ncbi:ubiquinone biosynthesis protein COQ9 [Medicago truncatula]|uniref:Ubiquinone biosynthesis protein n=1 Tax=Medicago truncatula TaxID=3880 RepID=G7JS82_MEDTR|nr:ubiquinone biosynthesis protein COQ9 [Medicago truncatula]
MMQFLFQPPKSKTLLSMIPLLLQLRHHRQPMKIHIASSLRNLKPSTRMNMLDCFPHHSFTSFMKLGWTETALMAGAKDVGLSPSIVGSLSRKEAALVEFYMDDCLQRLIDKIDTDGSLKNLTPSDCISKLIRFRLEMQAPYISTWPQALSIQAQPVNVPTSFKQRAMLVDEIWHAAGDNASDLDWYAKRTVLGGIYSTTEIYMLTDGSADFRDTWAFLDARVKDAFDLKKTIQEAQYLAEAVSTGLGNTFEEFVGKVFRR